MNKYISWIQLVAKNANRYCSIGFKEVPHLSDCIVADIELVGNCGAETTRGKWLLVAFVKERVELEERLKIFGVFSCTIIMIFIKS